MIGKALNSTSTFLLGFLALAVTAEPQEYSAQEYSYDNAYIRFVDGELSLQRAQDPEPEPGEINLPVLPGDRVWTTGSSFAEIRFADATRLRLGEDTKVDFMAFGSEPIVRLWNGSVVVTVGDGSQVRVDTPSGSVYQRSPGTHRVDVHDGATTTVTVLEGVAELASDRSSVLVDAGQRSVLAAGGEPENPFAFNTSGADRLDTWTLERDREPPRRREVPLAPLGEVSTEVHQYVDDLEDYGSWGHEQEVGAVWYPTVSAGWAPYRDGRWCYTSYGYTWVSYESWGWAPYHYGRWGYGHRGWYWVPGRHWSPAWVSFAVGPAWIGWSPLGYHGGSVFAYDHAYYGGGRYPYGNGRRYYRGGKAVPRHVYDHGAGWNFSEKEHFRHGGKARLRASDVRSTSARARVANQPAVLDRNLTPRGVGTVNARAPLSRPFANQGVARTRAGGDRDRVASESMSSLTRRGGARSTSTPLDRSRATNSNNRGTLSRESARARQRNTGAPPATETTSESARAPRGFEATASRTRVYRSEGATRTDSARRRTIPTRSRPEQTSPQTSRSRSTGTTTPTQGELRTRGQDYFESSSRRRAVTRSQPGARGNPSANRAQSQGSTQTRAQSQRGSSRSNVTRSRSGSSNVNRRSAPQRTQSGSSNVSGSRSRGSSSSSGRARSGGNSSRSGGARGRNR